MRTRPHGVQEVDIVGIFLQDSALHYVFTISGIVLFNLLGLLSGVRTNTALLDASFIVAGTRLILHLRRSFYGRQTEESLPRSLEPQGPPPKSRKLTKLPRTRTFTRFADESFWGDEPEEPPHSPEPAISTARINLSIR
ncbi:hypothetical protein EXIGLDRAFT_192809 [Exidia glandulosa HHB12029]|uniref:Uncharacterized protein n=1 Tax=Exidia glandulosa HHB12029 TaxID=1314781 RepID=A0A165EXC4_EXIGL|nr:hypothetical protein EXIGLDRAFT_192809 [Exidia glandulosa HHB12029]